MIKMIRIFQSIIETFLSNESNQYFNPKAILKRHPNDRTSFRTSKFLLCLNLGGKDPR